MIKVDGAKLVLDGADGLLLKELAYLVCMIKSRMASRGAYTSAQIHDAVLNAVSNADTCTLDDLRVDARVSAVAEL